MREIEAIKKYYADRVEAYDITAGYLDVRSEKLRKNMKKKYQKFFKGHKVLEIACGTGYWTKVVAKTAHSVLATDINRTMLSLARKRLAKYKNVKFSITDAYKLNRIPGGFSFAFSHWWWSHMPKSKIRGFLTNLHKKLKPGARVFFSDHLPGYMHKKVEVIFNKDGDRLEVRHLKTGKKCYIIKNFPTKEEINSHLLGLGRNIKFKNYHGRWELTYNTLY
jgi:SAM-dependent methyltransferase